MTRVILYGLPSLDNYGTAMMGFVTIQSLASRLQGPVQIMADFDGSIDLDEIYTELDVDRSRLTLSRFQPRPKIPAASVAGIHHRLRVISGDRRAAHADLMLVLGGDDLSEYYRPDVWRMLYRIWMMGRTTPTALLGQTIGPFNRPANRLAFRTLLPGLLVIPRDRWTTSYLRSELGLSRNLVQGADLAWWDLPLQHRTDIEQQVLDRYGLQRDGYATVVISGMQNAGYYTRDRSLYLQRWKEIVEALLDLPEMAGRKLCLLAHTFGIYGDEGANANEVAAMLSDAHRARVITVPDRLLPTRARFILGNGLFTVTGRMHPAVSTFQMGKPAISLSYSKKFDGVIGTMIGRSDLILEANDPGLWESGRIVADIVERARDVLARHRHLTCEIRSAVATQKALVAESLDRIAALVDGR